MLSVSYAECHIQALYAEGRYAECRYAECLYAKCRSTFLQNSVTATYFKLSFDKLRRSYFNVGHAFSRNGEC